jgi:aconitate hydratase
MAFDIEMIKKVYGQMAERIDSARKVVGKPLTLSEYDVLLTHKKNI